MKNMVRLFCLSVLIVIIASGCTGMFLKPAETIKSFPTNSTEQVIDKGAVKVDEKVSSSGGGSFRIEASGPVNVRLFESGDIDFENGKLGYRAKVKTAGVQGQAYLEMWCVFKDKGEFFSKGLDKPLTGDNEWKTIEIPFSLKKKENPDNVKLNFVVNGKGTVWIDSIELVGYRNK